MSDIVCGLPGKGLGQESDIVRAYFYFLINQRQPFGDGPAGEETEGEETS